MKCPICEKAVSLKAPFLPFCSARCKERDLGNWASGKYVFSTPADPESEEFQEKLREKLRED
jgi:endogenous inhibitor of DNA gyrase (YacG/DUF329 family)